MNILIIQKLGFNLYPEETTYNPHQLSHVTLKVG